MGKKSKKLKMMQKKQQEHNAALLKDIPKSMVFRRGRVGEYVSELVMDMRRVMSPYTAKSLQESKRNTLKDFVSVSSPLGVTHFLIFSQTVAGVNLRLVRLPHGPTLSFRVNGYSNIRDIVHMQKKPHSPGSEYAQPPLVVLNNFSAAALAQAAEQAKQEDAEEAAAAEAERLASPTATLIPPSADTLKLTATMFQNMFPPIDVSTLQVKDCRRVVLLQYEPKTSSVLFRHFLISAAPVGLNRGIKKLMKSQIPDLGHLRDISEFVKDEYTRALSDSEAEDAPDAKITLPQAYHGRGNRAANKSAIRLHELGPRMDLQLMKIEEEMDGGKVIYHYRKKRSEAEIEALARKQIEAKEEKARRREEQQRNVEKKMKRKRGIAGINDEEDEDEVEGMEADPHNIPNASQVDDIAMGGDDGDDDEGGMEDDADWYRREVGEEPSAGMFDASSNKSNKKKERNFPNKHERRAEELKRKSESGELAARKPQHPQKKKQKTDPTAQTSHKKKGATTSFKNKHGKGRA